MFVLHSVKSVSERRKKWYAKLDLAVKKERQQKYKPDDAMKQQYRKKNERKNVRLTERNIYFPLHPHPQSWQRRLYVTGVEIPLRKILSREDVQSAVSSHL
jgi:hypothetical protein